MVCGRGGQVKGAQHLDLCARGVKKVTTLYLHSVAKVKVCNLAALIKRMVNIKRLQICLGMVRLGASRPFGPVLPKAIQTLTKLRMLDIGAIRKKPCTLVLFMVSDSCFVWMNLANVS